jgi:hypothetical protein
LLNLPRSDADPNPRKARLLGAARTSPPPERRQSLVSFDEGQPPPFSQQWVTITKQEHIDLSDLADEEKSRPTCGLPHLPTAALDEYSDMIEVEVKAHVRHIRRRADIRNPGCTGEDTPAILTAPPPPRVISRSDYDVSFWVEVILGKYRDGQPTNRYLQDLKDQGLAVSPGTVAGGLQAIASLFEPIVEALYCQQMSERLFHHDETRWEVFRHRWCSTASTPAAVPGAHFQ